MIWQLGNKVKINQLGQQKFSNVVEAFGLDEGIIKDVWDYMTGEIITVKFSTKKGESLSLDVDRDYLENLELEHQ